MLAGTLAERNMLKCWPEHWHHPNQLLKYNTCPGHITKGHVTSSILLLLTSSLTPHELLPNHCTQPITSLRLEAGSTEGSELKTMLSSDIETKAEIT